MHIIHADFKKGHVKVKITSPDDLWHLSQIIHEGDHVRGRSYRKIKLGGSEEKSQTVKKAIVLKLTVEKIEFDKHKNSLRLNGKVTEGPDDVPHGSYHTITAEEGHLLEIFKEQFLDYQQRHLQEAAKEKNSKILLVTLDREEAYFALLKKYGFEYVGELKGEVEKKYLKEKVRKSFYEDVVKVLEGYVERMGLEKIVIGSPAFWKDELYKKLPEPLKKMTILATCHGHGETGINELLKRDEVKTALQEERIAKEAHLLEELLRAISRGDPNCYGYFEVEEAAQAGAIETLLVTDKFMRKSIHGGEHPKLPELMKTVEQTRGKVHIISSDHDAGERLDGLGGIAALMRYKLH